jgi:hypothetical protein
VSFEPRGAASTSPISCVGELRAAWRGLNLTDGGVVPGQATIWLTISS